MARKHFAARGIARTSVRGIAAAAGVNAALVHYYFGTKDNLYVAALQPAADRTEVLFAVVAGGIDGAGERVLRSFFTVWEDETARLPLLALVRGVFEADGRRLFSDSPLLLAFCPRDLALDVDDPTRRITLVASQLAGLIILRYVLEIEPIASAPVDQVVATYAPVIQRYLSGPLP